MSAQIIHVAPGQIRTGYAGDQLRSVLGSCIAVTLWQPYRRIGVMSHILLPARNLPPSGRLDGRFADEALVIMGMQLAELGISPLGCECKIFGGAHVFAHEFANMGPRNLASVRAMLDAAGVAIVSEHVGGGGYRELRFDVATGHAWVRHRRNRLVVPARKEVTA